MKYVLGESIDIMAVELFNKKVEKSWPIKTVGKLKIFLKKISDVETS